MTISNHGSRDIPKTENVAKVDHATSVANTRRAVLIKLVRSFWILQSLSSQVHKVKT